MATQSRVKVSGVPGLFRRGKVYEYKLSATAPDGRRRYYRKVLGTDKAHAVAVLSEDRARLSRGTMTERSTLTVAEFLTDHWLPAVKPLENGRSLGLEMSTWEKYQRDVANHVVPGLGSMQVQKVRGQHITALLRVLADDGRKEASFRGAPRKHHPAVYDLIYNRRREGLSSGSVLDEIVERYPSECGITRHAIARIYARECEARSRPATATASGLAVSTVKNIADMLQGAWKWGLKNDYLDRAIGNVVKDADRPIDKDHDPEREVWTADQANAFFLWQDSCDRPHRLLDFWKFTATSADRRGGNLGLRWSAIDFDEGTANLNFFVEVDSKKRIVVKHHGKQTRGHVSALDSLTIEILRARRDQQERDIIARLDEVHLCSDETPECPRGGYHDRGLVFPGPDGNYQHPERARRELQRVIARYNREHPDCPLPIIDLHSLRHFWSSVASEKGVPHAVRKRRLDHSSDAMTHHYTRSDLDQERAAAEAVARRILGVAGPNAGPSDT